MARHTALSMMIKSGIDAKTFVSIAGHSSTDVTNSQLMIVFSRSSESSYVLSKSEIAKRQGVKIVAITSSQESTLGKMADLILPIYGSREPLDVSFNITSYNSIAILFIDLILQLFMGSVSLDFKGVKNAKREREF